MDKLYKMRKLIAILLIAVIDCVEVDTTPKNEESYFNELLDLLDLDVNSVELNCFANIFKKIGNVFQGTWDKVKQSIEWLKKKGIWSAFKTIAKNHGRVAATTFCSSFFSPEICEPLVNTVFGLIKQI